MVRERYRNTISRIEDYGAGYHSVLVLQTRRLDVAGGPQLVALERQLEKLLAEVKAINAQAQKEAA